jgi:hypothetical protein
VDWDDIARRCRPEHRPLIEHFKIAEGVSIVSAQHQRDADA